MVFTSIRLLHTIANFRYSSTELPRELMRLFIFPLYSGNTFSFLNNVHILPLRFIAAKAITAVIACLHCVFEKSVFIKRVLVHSIRRTYLRNFVGWYIK